MGICFLVVMFFLHMRRVKCCCWTCFFEWGGLSVPTWDNFWVRGSSGWSFLPPFPTVSHSAPASSELTVGDEGGVVFFLPAGVGETTGASLSVFVGKNRSIYPSIYLSIYLYIDLSIYT